LLDSISSPGVAKRRLDEKTEICYTVRLFVLNKHIQIHLSKQKDLYKKVPLAAESTGVEPDSRKVEPTRYQLVSRTFVIYSPRLPPAIL